MVGPARTDAVKPRAPKGASPADMAYQGYEPDELTGQKGCLLDSRQGRSGTADLQHFNYVFHRLRNRFSFQISKGEFG